MSDPMTDAAPLASGAAAEIDIQTAKPEKLRVLFVTPECYPMVKTGGLGDVSGALPPALRRLGIDVRLLLPGYPAVRNGLAGFHRVGPIPDLPGGAEAYLAMGTSPIGVPVYVLDCPVYFDRPGNPYLDAQGQDWPDNAYRFAALGWTAAQFRTQGFARNWAPSLVHAHDWQAGLAPAYLALSGSPRPASLMTIHNIAYQGWFPATMLTELGLPQTSFAVDGLEYYGGIGFLKAGVFFADHITTVSPAYAAEIQTPEHGAGLHGLLAGRANVLTGIVNGADYGVWTPARDPHLVAPYDVNSLDRKALNKRALQQQMGLPEAPDVPLFGVVSRLNTDKGMDVLVDTLPALAAIGAQAVILGSGVAALESALLATAAKYPQAIAVNIGYDEALAHRIQAGADMLMVPSREEPCGLTQLYALRYGTLPIVSSAGGLGDTIIDANFAGLTDGCATGFVFSPVTADKLWDAIRRALAVYVKPEARRSLQHRSMSRDFSWTVAARAYADLYNHVAKALRVGTG